MKTRSGFVSNSSSSSFIIMGVPLNESIEALMRKIVPPEADEEDWDYYDRYQSITGLSVLYTERPHAYLVGQIIADVGSDGDYLEFKEYSIYDLEILASNVMRQLGLGDLQPKLMMGTRPS